MESPDGSPEQPDDFKVRSAVDIQRQIQIFSAQKPACVLSISPPRLARAICVAGDVVRPVDIDDGPWETTMVIRGPRPYYDQPITALLVWWPMQELPQVTFHSIMHHQHASDTDSVGMLPDIFYDQLFDKWEAIQALADSGGQPACSLAAVVQQVVSFFEGPLHPCEQCTPEWESLAEQNQSRTANLNKYVGGGIRKHPALFEGVWDPNWLVPELADALRTGNLAELMREETPGVYSFPMLKPEICQMMLEECDNYSASGLPIRRPNSMNNYGLILNEIGMEPFIDAMQQAVLWPVAQRLWHTEAARFDRHHTFLVRYKPGEDLGLDVHTDDSDVTFNVCLGKEFTGSGLVFCGMLGRPEHRKLSAVYHHEAGRCVVHLGRKRHGADNIATGERINLIIWNVNDNFRQTDEYSDHSLYQQEAGAPDVRCLSFTHDRDIEKYSAYPEGKQQLQGKGWCPPHGLEHDYAPSP